MMLGYKRKRVSDMIYLHSPEASTDLISSDSPDKVKSIPLIQSANEAERPTLSSDNNNQSLCISNPFDDLSKKVIRLENDSIQSYVEEAIGYSVLSASLGSESHVADHGNCSEYPLNLSKKSNMRILDETFREILEPWEEVMESNRASTNHRSVDSDGVDAGADLRCNKTSLTCANTNVHLLNVCADTDLSILNDSEMDDSLLDLSRGEHENLLTFEVSSECINYSKTEYEKTRVEENSLVMLDSTRPHNLGELTHSHHQTVASSLNSEKLSLSEHTNTLKVPSIYSAQPHRIDSISNIPLHSGVYKNSLSKGNSIRFTQSQSSSSHDVVPQGSQHGSFKTKTHNKLNRSPYSHKIPRPTRKSIPKVQVEYENQFSLS
ncbi:hypothetical protein QAD02_010156 [Eretmocerus hayati]|uniref:Uncharacterized protein n=1 Tax=Eretmocerus hayati TaxID=131215 RepID=A0ACC2NCI3_9HYME|nr:hypothetical protein QAD02_010156 [Eretmocerus hayati]